MAKKPQRIENHRLEHDSETHFIQALPRDWVSYKPNPDYGVDLIVDIFDGNDATGRDFQVQLKSSEESDQSADGAYERLKLKVATFNYLYDRLQVVLLVKYVASENTAYWQLLSQVPVPNQNNDSMTVRLPRHQTVNPGMWRVIRQYVEYVHLKKLGARAQTDLAQFL